MPPDTRSHDGPLCGAVKRQGEGTCRRPAGWGTDHGPRDGQPGVGRCKLHGGRTPTQRTGAARDLAAAAAARIGVAQPVEPHEALELVVASVNGGVEYLRRRLAELDEAELLTDGELHPTARAFLAELDRLARAAKLAADAGVEERRTKIAEHTAERVALVLRAVVDELDLSAAQQERLRFALARHLPLLSSGGVATSGELVA